MSGEHDHCPFCGDDMCDGRCYDALLDRLANAGIDMVAKDRRIKELEAKFAAADRLAEAVRELMSQVKTHSASSSVGTGPMHTATITDLSLLVKLKNLAAKLNETDDD